MNHIPVSTTKRILLTMEAVVALSPAVLALFFWAFMYIMPLLHGAPDNGPMPHMQMIGTIVVGVAAVLAAFLMLGYILDGRRTLPRFLMLVLALVGLYITGRMAFDTLEDDGPLLFVVLPAAPFLCGLHFLWLGRRYFSRGSGTEESSTNV